jgi:transcriptional regulator with XRE-family HTH domain
MSKKNIQIIGKIWGKGMNQTELAKKLRISESRLSRILHLYVTPTLDEIEGISKAIDIDAESLREFLKGVE